MSAELRLTASQFAELNNHLLSDEFEHAAILICETAGLDRDLLLCREVHLVTEEELESDSSSIHLEVSPRTVAHYLKRAKTHGQTLVMCHSHPFPGPVMASPIDLKTERQLCGRVISGRLDERPNGALILGPEGLDARMWLGGSPSPLRVRVGGRLLGENVRTVSSVEERYDRHLKIWGTAGQALLRVTSIAIVGAGGTGSHVVQQLAHLGIGHLLLVDPDVVDESNLSRLVGATSYDVGSFKVNVLSANAKRIRPDIRIDALPASVLDIDCRQLADTDLIVCCTDGHGSRALLNELASQYLITLIDLGVEIQITEEGRTRAGGGVRVVTPGDPCLYCSGVIDSALVREEFLTDTERLIESKNGYLRGTDEAAPSVVSLNGVVASLAVMEVLQQVLGLFGRSSRRVLYRAEVRSTTTAQSEPYDHCYVCGPDGLLGIGDARQLPRRVA